MKPLAKTLALLFFILVFVLGWRDASAAVLPPGNISSCGELAAPGTYTLTSNVSAVGTSSCFLVSSDNVTIDGAGFSITGSGDWGIDARSYDTGNVTLKSGANGFTNLLVNELTVLGFSGGINASGNSDPNGLGVNAGYGGTGGDIEVLYSVIGSISTNGGNASNKPYGGIGGNITITGDDLNISNSHISALAGTGTTGRNTDGVLDINYTGSLARTGLTLSSFSFLNDNATQYSSYIGGTWPITPGTISSCGTLFGSGTYVLSQNISNISGTCFTVGANNVILNGAGYSISSADASTTAFAIRASGYSGFVLASTTVTNYSNLVISSSSVSITGTDVDISNKFIAVGSLALTYSGTLAKTGATATTLSNLTVNGVSYGSRFAGPLFDWVARMGDSNRQWQAVASSVNGVKLVAAVFGGQIYTSTDSGATWTARDSNRSWQSVASSADGAKLVAVAQSGQIYTSINSGSTWTARDSNRNWISVASSADGAKLVAVVNGGQIYTSADSGVTWTPRDSNRNWRAVASSADGAKLVAAVFGGQIYTSINSGATWTARDSSRNWRAVASSADGAKLVAVVQNGQIYTSADSGATWAAHESSRAWRAVASSADGTKLVAVASNALVYTYQNATPSLYIHAPSAGSISSWAPSVLWNNFSACYYSFNDFVSTTTADCASYGSDIPNPGYGTHALSLRGVDSSGGIVGSSVSFVYGLHIGVSSPVQAASVTAWAPSVDWDSADAGNITTCQYSYDGFVSTSTANCSLAGSDISAPSALGSAVLSLRIVDSNGVVGTNSVYFTYAVAYDWTARDSNRNWRAVASSADGARLVAAVFGGQIYTSINSGATWTARDSSRNWRAVASSADGAKLVAVVSSGQIYTSTDSGVTWTARDSSRGWFSVASSADGARLVAVAQSGQIYTSTDSGVTWTARDSNRNWYSVASSADGTRLVAVVQNGQIYTSADSGVTWTPRDSNRNWRAVASSADGAKLVAAVFGGQIYTSTDSGVTWTPRDSNRNWQSVASSADASKMVATVANGQPWVSNDSGVTWVAQDSERNWAYVTSSSDGLRLAAVVQNGQIYTFDPSLIITRPVSSSSVLHRDWSPLVNWGNSASCYYSYNEFVSTSTASCANAGSDILPPSIEGSATLYIRGIDSLGNQFNSMTSFAYEPWTARDSSRVWSSVASSADGTKLVAVVSSGQIYTSTDSGATWTARDSSRNWQSVASSADGTKLVAVVGSGQIYTSINSGATWTARDSSRVWSSVASSADGTKLVAVVSNGQIYTSTDSGATWTARDSSRVWRAVASSADGTKLVAAAFGGQIYTSINSGATWTARDSSRVWRSISSSADGTKLVAVVSSGQIYTSTDSGATWTARDSSRNWQSVASSADGTKLVAVVSNGQIYTALSLPVITSPTVNSTVSLWTPAVFWDRSVSCEYSHNGTVWASSSCAGTGLDIPAPSGFGISTLYARGVDRTGLVSTSTVSFVYSPVLSAGTISSCGTISASGTYTLSADISDVPGTCLVISANNVTIDGAGHTITASGGNSGYPVNAGGRTGLVLKDISFSGFGLGVVASSVTYRGSDIVVPDTGASSLSIEYTNTLASSGTFSGLSNLIINGIDLQDFDGSFAWSEQDISSCGTISSPGLYRLTQDITEVVGTCFVIDTDIVIIDGNGHSLSAADGNTEYAITATLPDSSAHQNIGVSDLTLIGFGGGIDSRGSDGITGDTAGKSGGDVSLYGVVFPIGTVSVNASGGDALYENNGTATGGFGGNLIISSSTLGALVLDGGDSVGDETVGYDNGSFLGGSPGALLTFITSTRTSLSQEYGRGYLPGCMDDSYDNYDSEATYDNGSCTSLIVGTQRDNYEGDTISGPIDFRAFSNRGIVDGDAQYFGVSEDYSYFSSYQGNYGTTTGYAYFYDDFYATNGPDNYGYVAGGATFDGTMPSNYGVIDGFVAFSGFSSTNYGTVNGNADFTNGGSSYGYNYGTVNGDATFYDRSGFNQGTVTGSITYYFGCSDPAASNFDPEVTVISDDGSCIYYGTTSDLPEGITFVGNLDFSGYSNYGTVDGNATFSYGYNYGTVTGDATFYDYFSNSGTLVVDNSFSWAGTGVVDGDMFDANSVQITDFEFSNGMVNSYTVKGNPSFLDTSRNNGDIIGDVSFYGTPYSSTTPSGGVMSFEGGASWIGSVSGTVYGADSNPITTYVFYDTDNLGVIDGDAEFYGTSRNLGTVTGDAIFYDTAYNNGSILGDATFAEGSSGTFELSGSMRWAGTIGGSIKGGDDAPIANLVFNDSSKNYATIASGISVIFNDASSNEATVSGDATFNNTSAFKIGTVLGTATLSGFSQTIQSVNNVFNLIKQIFSRDTLYLTSGSTLNVSGLFTLLGGDANNLLTVKSTVPGSYANIGVNGTSAFDFLRLKDINNTGASVSLVGKTAYDDGHNSGFTFNPNSSSGSRSGLTSGVSRPSTPTTRAAASSVGASTPVNRGATTGTSEALREFRKATALALSTVSLPVNLVGRLPALTPLPVFGGTGANSFSFQPLVSKFLFQPLPETLVSGLSSSPRLSAYISSLGVTSAQGLARLKVNPVLVTGGSSSGTYLVSKNGKVLRTTLSSDGRESLFQEVRVGAGEAFDVSMSPAGVMTFDGKRLSVTAAGEMRLIAPDTAGSYILRSSVSPLILVVRVDASAVTSQSQAPSSIATPKSLWQRLLGLFSGVK